MSFDQFLNQAWNDHASQAGEVASRLKPSMALIEKPEQIAQMAGLITHVFGEHLGQWQNGIEALKSLRQLSVFQPETECEFAIRRSIASLKHAAGDLLALNGFSASDQIRILAVSASALSEQNQSETAQKYFQQALELATKTELTKEDPAIRALAVTGNNLAGALEEKAHRNPTETQLMILAAQSARKYWEVAGTWFQVERAEYRLSQSYLKSGDANKSLEHAKKCLEIIQKNQAPALEAFFAFEAIALAHKASHEMNEFRKAIEQMNLQFQDLSEDDKSWCEPILKKLADLQ